MASLAFPTLSKSIKTKDGTKYGYVKVDPKEDKPTLLFLHGYPSSSYHWHNQVKQCQDAGYGAIIPDLLGYGDTDKPDDFKAYDNTLIAKQVMDILDAEGIEKVVGVGHDWGANLLSAIARHHPDRFLLFIWMSVGYTPSQARLTDVDGVNQLAIKLIGRPIFGYWIFHNKPEAAKVIENADPDSISSFLYPEDPETWVIFCEPGGMESWMKENKKTKIASWITPEQIALHDKILRDGGYTGPLNWYKQAMAGVTAKSEEHLTDEQRKIKLPTLFIGTKRDMICIPEMQVAGMKGLVEDLTVESLDTGHWCMLEKPDETWAFVDKFIKARL